MTRETPDNPIRAAFWHGGVTVALALLLLIGGGVAEGGVQTALIVAAMTVMIIGSFAAMIRTWLVWRAHGRWQVWQGATWFLLAATILWVFTTIPILVVDR